jgi:hypothetical protein
MCLQNMSNYMVIERRTVGEYLKKCARVQSDFAGEIYPHISINKNTKVKVGNE